MQYYIKYGWDQYLVDPDKGANSRRKLAAVQNPQSLTSKLLLSIPNENDPLWENRLYRIPKITFSTIYDFLVDRKVLLRRVSCLECIADKRAEEVHNFTKGDKGEVDTCKEEGKVNSKEQTQVDSQWSSESDCVYVPVEYTRTLDKAYCFFKDGHVQQIRYHAMPSEPGYVCVGATVLPSMRKD